MNSKIDTYEQHEIMVQQLFDELMGACVAICKSEDDAENIRKAFYFAKDAHKGVLRKSGIPYITHPLAVAKIVVSEIGLGTKSVIAALLHDVVEDTHYTVEDIEHRFGKKIATMVDGLTKLGGVFDTDISEQAENFRKMLLTLSDDARVILIKIADRLHNMRTLGSMPQHKQMKIASETIYLFAPLAHKLGLYLIKSELENLSLKYRFPEEYNEIDAKLKNTEEERRQFLKHFINPIADKLKDSDIEFEISDRVKSVYSVWKKMKSKNLTFDEIYDLCAIRIVFKTTPMVPEKSQCWHIYSLITDIYQPKPDRIRDWVTMPKANGYEALHSTLMSKEGIWVEVQIRSERMNDIAEHGYAAHWKYKNADNDGDKDPLLAQLRENLRNPSENAVEFLENFKLDLQSSEIVVFTPKGESRIMPKRSTVLDFAYAIHSKIGNSAIGAKINYKLAPISETLSTGDQIEIITSKSAHPVVQWLDYVTTSKAKAHITSYLKGEHVNTAQHGQEIFETELKKLAIGNVAQILHKMLKAFDCVSKDQFYTRVGMGIITTENLHKAIKQNSGSKYTKFWTIQIPNTIKQIPGVVTKGNKSKKNKSEWYAIAECCNPIPGDEIIGFKIAGDRIEVHKKSCPTAIKKSAQEGGTIVDPKWSSVEEVSFLATIDFKGIDRLGIIYDLAMVISTGHNVNINAINVKSQDGIFHGTISLFVKNQKDLNKLIDKITHIEGIEKVSRNESNNVN